MKLLLDLGNSRLKWAWLSEGSLQRTGDFAHGGQNERLACLGPERDQRVPDEILLASVAAPDLTESVAGRLSRRWAVPVRQAYSEAGGSGVVNGYADPAQMGVDRWLAMVAAWARHRAAVCVADAGTALTVDLVARDGCHQGGLILPGPAMMVRSLLADTGRIASSAAMLPQGTENGAALGRDTEACMRSAALRASACLVAGCMKAFPDGSIPRLVLTGGDAAQLLVALGANGVDYRPWLVLEGLALRLCGVLPAVTSS